MASDGQVEQVAQPLDKSDKSSLFSLLDKLDGLKERITSMAYKVYPFQATYGMACRQQT